TNLSVNLARSTSPAIFVGGWAVSQLWVFWAAPIDRRSPCRRVIRHALRDRSEQFSSDSSAGSHQLWTLESSLTRTSHCCGKTSARNENESWAFPPRPIVQAQHAGRNRSRLRR